MTQIKCTYLRLVIFLLIVVIPTMNSIALINESGLLRAQESNQISNLLALSEENYYSGNFSQAIELANQVLNDSRATDIQKQQAFIILTKISLALEKPDMAEKYLVKVLEIDPSYQPTIEEETPQFVNFVAQVRSEYTKPPRKNNKKGLMKWMAVGAGAIITVAVVAVMASGTTPEEEKPDNTLPEPPAFP